MLFLHKVDAQRPVRIKRRRLPRTHIFFTTGGCFLHQHTNRLRHACKLARFLYVSVDPLLPRFPFNRRHRFPLRSSLVSAFSMPSALKTAFPNGHLYRHSKKSDGCSKSVTSLSSFSSLFVLELYVTFAFPPFPSFTLAQFRGEAAPRQTPSLRLSSCNLNL